MNRPHAVLAESRAVPLDVHRIVEPGGGVLATLAGFGRVGTRGSDGRVGRPRRPRVLPEYRP
jgi:hypothetical protein